MSKQYWRWPAVLASILASASTVAQDHAPSTPLRVPANCGYLAAQSGLMQFRSQAGFQRLGSGTAQDQLGRMAQLLSEDTRFIKSLQCFQTLSSSGRE